MTNAVKSQILAVRDTGLTNMFDIHAVQAIAYKNDWHELVVYLEDKANRMEYSRFIMTGEASTEDEISEQDDEELSEEEYGVIEERFNLLFNDLVPSVGKADTLAGEIIRATSRIGYRFNNDGDRLGVGYGNETCNPAGRFLIARTDHTIAAIVRMMWGEKDYDAYQHLLYRLLRAVVDFVETHPELRKMDTPDMYDYSDEKDVDRCDDDEDW